MRILRIAVRRVLLGVPLLVILLLVTVALQKITPGDPARALAGPRASEEVLAATRVKYRLDDGVVAQFTSAVGRAVRGDLGVSNRSDVPVTDLLVERGPRSVLLAAVGLSASVLIAFPLGLAAGTRGRRLRSAVDQAGLVLMNLPTYWLALVVVLVFALRLEWFPTGGTGSGWWGTIHHLVLPTAVMAAAIAPVLVRSLAASVERAMRSDHVVTALAAGIPRAQVIRRHVVRNALPPVVTLLGLQAGGVLFGLVVVELSFGINGLGTLLFDSVRNRDFPVVQGLTLVLGACVVVANLLADLVGAVLDPRSST